MIQGLLARPAFLRWLGLAGAVCCAVDAFLYGAAPFIRRNVNVVTVFREPAGPLVLLLWFGGLAALCVAWWYGRRLLGRGLLSTRWILTTAALWSAPMLVVPPLASRDLYANACQGALVHAGLNPYLVGVSAQPCPWLDSVSVVWRDTPTPYGPVFLVLAGLAAAFGSQLAALVAFRVLAVLGVVAIAAGLPVLARRVGAPVDRALWLVLCCPLVPVHLIGGGHNDALTVAFMVAGFAVLAGPPKTGGIPAAEPAPSGTVAAAEPVPSGGVSAPEPVPSGGVAAAEPVPSGAASAAEPVPSRAVPAAGSPPSGSAPQDADAAAGGSARKGWGTLVAGGVLLGLAVSIKITIGVVLPFAALLAVGGLRAAGWAGLLRRGGVVLAAALAVLVAGSYASGLGLGWLTALSGAGESVNWSSPPTAVGLAVEAAGRWFGADLAVVPVVRAVALVLLAVVLVVVLWRFRDRDPLVGAGLALLAVIFFAPITQPWYLIWPLALFAAGTARVRWLAGTVVFAMITILPEGTGVFRPLGVPMSFAMIVLIGWVVRRSVSWLRGDELVAAA
ncbi:hypothetical protein GCM10020358_70070 [Amorphoplanes nipponensis]|uniref:Alpha-1,6-mannosyltransferase n=1 Tax=Actinoplanes nipponensis TaxID=135950 RepID=A0A919JI38_9ACTN|nr:polyprenol phosphomannose-dependent alpha 1,6 mannosyltransferase MptB [Actinoplanes nipponensis]GIE51133.1 hypothetical protein Ani05nite_46670 [Actinoplanes nipponensis]